MKKILVLIALLPMIAFVKAQEGNLQNLYASRIIIGSDSTAVFVRQGILSLKDGKAGIKNISDVDGALRIDAPGNGVKAIVMRQDSTYSTEVNFESYYEMVRSNIGKNVEVEVRENQTTTGYEGIISDYGINPAYFMMLTSYGTQSIAFNKIENLGFNENIVNKSKSIKRYPVAEIEFANKVDKQQVTLTYSKKGLWWEPVYSYTYQEGSEGTLELQALISNIGEDVYNTDIYLTGKSSERNAYLYGQRGINIMGGSKTLVPIFKVTTNKKDVLRIVVDANEHKFTGSYLRDTFISEMQCEMINQSEYDWAMGKIKVFDEFSAPLGNATLSETPAGSRTTIVAGQNPSIYAIVHESRTPRVSWFKSSEEKGYKVSGSILLVNNSGVDEKIEVMHYFNGKIRASKDGSYSFINEGIVWTSKLKSEERKLLSYKYKTGN